MTTTSREPSLGNLLDLFDPNGSYDGWDVQERIREAFGEPVEVHADWREYLRDLDRALVDAEGYQG